MSKTIVLKVDNKEIPMNEFVQRVFSTTIGGLVDALDKIPEDRKKIEIVIEEGGN